MISTIYETILDRRFYNTFSRVYHDAANNRIFVDFIYEDEAAIRRDVFGDGLKLLLVVTLVDDIDCGYVVAVDDTAEEHGGFGTAETPSSYRRPCLGWFGPNEAHKDAHAVINATCVK